MCVGIQIKESTKNIDKTVSYWSVVRSTMWSMGRKRHLEAKLNQHVNSCMYRVKQMSPE